VSVGMSAVVLAADLVVASAAALVADLAVVWAVDSAAEWVVALVAVSDLTKQIR